ncbi:MAG: DNA repair protein RecO [Tepidimonas sp.]|uniref:DNA repair protein RecO n=1 Tax=Tepidimonas sp. TaxID=2002775 RepID=UPI00298F1E32|nr:DNA repair protein RecO [Tepidimonas sp.]MDW8337041.1 DNA repair protein RecO [Tepidimonas sp.]
MARRGSRVHDEPGYVVHQHDWSESSLILDVFTRHHGRVVLVAKGAKRPSSQLRAVLLALQPLRLDWGGSDEVRTLKAASWAGGHVLPQGEALLAGFHLNELLLRLLPRGEPQPDLFDAYAAAVQGLAQGQPVAVLLRAFELLLLRAQGWLPDLRCEAATLQPLRPEGRYRLLAEHGLLPDEAAVLGGHHWLRLAQALAAAEPWSALLTQAQDVLASAALRQQLAALLHYHSGVRRLRARALLREARQLLPILAPSPSASTS